MIALAVLSAFQAASSLKQAEEIRMSADLTNKLSEINAKYADYDAYQAEKQGYSEVASYQPTIDATIGAQRTAYASQGVDVTFGSAAEVQKDTVLQGELNKIELMNRARTNAMGFRNEARNIRTGQSVRKSQAEIQSNAVMTSGIIEAGSTAFRSYTTTSPDGLKSNVLGSSNYSRT